MAESVDLNADVGEYDSRAGSMVDVALIPHLTSVNIACGYHAGDDLSMRDTVRLAVHHGVAVGAHPSFFDREHFGRRELDLPRAELEAMVVAQVTALAVIAGNEGAAVTHVKPHGALYNMAAREAAIADAVAAAVRAVNPALVLVGLAGSELIAAGRRAGLRTASEVFADRAYRADGSLVPRSEPGAVIHDPNEAAARAVDLVTRQDLRADTICVHSDTPGAARLAAGVRRALEEGGIRVRALTR
jgi:UPF0271 protein